MLTTVYYDGEGRPKREVKFEREVQLECEVQLERQLQLKCEVQLERTKDGPKNLFVSMFPA